MQIPNKDIQLQITDYNYWLLIDYAQADFIIT